jgi:hypothetical protein
MDNKNTFCDGRLYKDISNILTNNLFDKKLDIEGVYENFKKVYNKSSLNTNANSIIEIKDITSYKQLLANKSNIENLGIDLPIYFGDPNNTNRIMIVAMDPKRSGQYNDKISIGSVFALHKKESRDTKKNDYWSTFSFRSNDSIFFQDGLGSFLVDEKESTKMTNYLQNRNYVYSPSCFYQINSRLILMLIVNKAYNYCGVNLARLVIVHDELGVVIADSFHITNPNILEIESNYANSMEDIGRITSVSQDSFKLSKNANIQIIGRFPYLKHVYTSEVSSYCHEFSYNIILSCYIPINFIVFHNFYLFYHCIIS